MHPRVGSVASFVDVHPTTHCLARRTLDLSDQYGDEKCR